jgi:hypothetical protein
MTSPLFFSSTKECQVKEFESSAVPKSRRHGRLVAATSGTAYATATALWKFTTFGV